MSGHMNRTAAGRAAGATRVGVRDLKTHAARILRDMRAFRTPVLVTHRGRAIGMIVPVESEFDAPAATAEMSGASSGWDSFLEAGRRLAPRFKAGRNGVRLLSEMRR